MQREKRHLDGKGKEEGEKEQHLRSRTQYKTSALKHLLENRQIEAATRNDCCAQVIEPDDSHKHQNRARHRVEKKLYRGVDPVFVTPYADQQRQGNEPDLPEDKKEHEVKRKKNANDSDFQQKEHDVELFHAMLDIFPRSQYADRREEGNQVDEKDADAVDANVIIDGRHGNPVMEFLKLQAASAWGHGKDGQKGEKEFGNSDHQAKAADPKMIFVFQKQQGECTHRWKKNEDREQMSAVHQRTIPMTGLLLGQKKITAMTTIAPMTTHTA